MKKLMSQQQMEVELISIVHQLLTELDEPYKKNIQLDASLQRHLGIDSLSRAELFKRIEKTFSITLPDQLLVQAETLNDIMIYLISAAPTPQTKEQKRVFISHNGYSLVNPARAATLTDIILLYGEQSPQKPHIFCCGTAVNPCIKQMAYQ